MQTVTLVRTMQTLGLVWENSGSWQDSSP